MKQVIDPAENDLINGDQAAFFLENFIYSGVRTMKKEEILETLGTQMLKHLKISMISDGIDRREHLKLAVCFQQAALIILESL